MEEEDKYNNDSSPQLHVNIIEYQVQNMNVDQLKDNLSQVEQRNIYIL